MQIRKQMSGHVNLIYQKATYCIIYNHKVTNFTTICGINGLKTVKNSKKSKISVFRKLSPKNDYKILNEGPIDLNLAAKESSR